MVKSTVTSGTARRTTKKRGWDYARWSEDHGGRWWAILILMMIKNDARDIGFANRDWLILISINIWTFHALIVAFKCHIIAIKVASAAHNTQF